MEEGKAMQGCFLAKYGRPIHVMRLRRILSVPENRGACEGSKKNLGTADKRRRAYARPYGENETGRRSKDLNIICDTTASQDTAGNKAG